jgi:DEAD/DEAH box helicase domain-containing protein
VVDLLDLPCAATGLDAVEQLLVDLGTDGRLVHLQRFPARAARFGELRRPLPRPVREALGISAFWSHQAQAIDLARSGRSVVVATGTGSGKSLCYQAVVGEAAGMPVRSGTSLLLFPTKALAQDQLRALGDLHFPRVVAATYDGDCGPQERTWARSRANVVLTNPEMLHHGILPHHDRWARFLARLSYVVVDELHILRGIFGTHVAHLLRRLRRLCAHYGSSPTFIFTSATIGEPDVLANGLCGLDVFPVTDDGSPRGQRLFALWNPPVIDQRGMRASASAEAAGLAAALLREGRRAIVFCRSRKGTELLAADLKRRLPADLGEQVRPYRSGYLAEERREIEAALFGGELRGVVATSALELGVDVSGLDACVLTGFPGTVASMWQPAGRAGRGMEEAVTVLVAGEDQLDQWLMRHPLEVFRRPPEPAVINPGNPNVLLPHVQCAAFERPLSHLDLHLWAEDLDDAVRELVLVDRLAVRPRRGAPLATWTGSGWPSHGIGLRSAAVGEVKIMLTGPDERLVGTVDGTRAPNLVHPGAVYLHQGATYRVVDLDLDARVATVEVFDGEEYTMTRTSTSFRILRTDRTRAVGLAQLSLGTVEVASQVTGYQRIDTRTRVTVATEALDLPPSVLRTRAIWYTVGEDVLRSAGVATSAVPGALHAVEHAAIGILPLFAICDRWDVGGVSTALAVDTGLPTITIYDGYPGGAGIAELAFEASDRHLGATLDVVARCPCTTGCPSCVQSPKCGNGNEPLDKAAAAALLATVLGADVTPTPLPGA